MTDMVKRLTIHFPTTLQICRRAPGAACEETLIPIRLTNVEGMKEIQILFTTLTHLRHLIDLPELHSTKVLTRLQSSPFRKAQKLDESYAHVD